jgi:hypothetical protein
MGDVSRRPASPRRGRDGATTLAWLAHARTADARTCATRIADASSSSDVPSVWIGGEVMGGPQAIAGDHAARVRGWTGEVCSELRCQPTRRDARP